MLVYILRRLLYIIPTLLLISIISFVIIQAPPGDFLTSQIERLEAKFGAQAEAQIKVLRESYGLNEPMYKQYYNWMKGIITKGDFGLSFQQNKAVTEIIKERVPLTIVMTFVTLIFTWVIAIPIGVLSAVKQYSIYDYIFTFIAFIGRSIPNFLLALVLMFYFYSAFGWSLGGLFSPEYKSAAWSLAKLIDLAKHLVLPVIVIGTAGTAGLVRVLRGMMLDELGKQYVQTARAKGLSERVVIWKHIFKIAVLPIISTIGWLLPRLISGALVTSIVLNLPTTGATLFNALQNQDMYIAGSFVLILSTLTIIGTLISDVLLCKIDPRIRYE